MAMVWLPGDNFAVRGMLNPFAETKVDRVVCEKDVSKNVKTPTKNIPSNINVYDILKVVEIPLSEYNSLFERNKFDERGNLIYYKEISRCNKYGISEYEAWIEYCLLYTSPSPRDRTRSRMPSSA